MIYVLEYHAGHNRWHTVALFNSRVFADSELEVWGNANHPSAAMYRARVRDTGKRFVVDTAGKISFRKVSATGWDAHYQKHYLLFTFEEPEEARAKALSILNDRVKRAAADLKRLQTAQTRALAWEPRA